MRRTALLPLLLAASAAGAQQSAPPARRPMTPDDVMELRALGTVALSPDGRQVAYTVSAWEHPNAPRNAAPGDTARGDRHEVRSHVWLVPAAGGTPRQLTFGERGESSPAWSPDGKMLAFVTARPAPGAPAGEEPRPQVWLLPLDGGEPTPLTQARDGVSSFAWSPDGARVAYLSADTLPRAEDAKTRRRDDAQVYESGFRLAHLSVIDVATRRATEVVHGDFTVRNAPSWSPDGTRLAFGASPTPMLRDIRGDVYLVTLATKQLERVAPAPHAPTAELARPVWSPDGRTIAYTIEPQSDSTPEGIALAALGNGRLVLYDVATKRTREVRDPKLDVELGAPQWTPDGKRLLFVTGERAYQSVWQYDVAVNAFTRLANGLLLRGLSLSRDGKTVAYALETSASPADLHVGDLTFRTPRRLTTLNPQLAGFALGETEVVTWTSKDGTPVEGVLLKPVGYTPGTRYPLLVEAHGGPTGATTAGFKGSSSSPGQVWAGRGWAVLYPNPRGSTNYGEKFMRANIGDWGGGDYQDIMTGVDALIQRGIADSSRMAFQGWSYGGYLTAWTVTQTDRFKAARMGAGISDLVSMYGTTDIPGYLRLFCPGATTRERVDCELARSPLTHVDRVRTPLLILHGANDQRVPPGQAMQYFRALRDRGRPVELVLYPRAGHGLSEWYHQLDKMRREYDWIARYTLGAATKPTAAR